MKWLGGTLVFLSEMSMYAALFFWGYRNFDGYWGWLVGLTIPFFVSVFWSLCLSPRAPRPLPAPLKITVRLVLLLVGAATWWIIGPHLAAIAAATAALAGTAIAQRWPIDMPGVAATQPAAHPRSDEPEGRP